MGRILGGGMQGGEKREQEGQDKEEGKGIEGQRKRRKSIGRLTKVLWENRK